MVGRRARVSHVALPAGLHAILTYAVIIGLCYLFLIGVGWYNPELLAAVPVGIEAFLTFSVIVIGVVAALLYGIRHRTHWAYGLGVLWFLISILLSLVAIFAIDRSALPSIRYLLWSLSAITIAIDLTILWYLTNHKRYFSNRVEKIRFQSERTFVRVLNGCWVALLIISAALGTNFYRQSTVLADTSMEELEGTTIVHALVLCDTKQGQERDICYVVMATMFPGQELSPICSRVQSAFFKFTCYRTR